MPSKRLKNMDYSKVVGWLQNESHPVIRGVGTGMILFLNF
jgi:hypothetical protein